jgi:ABC-type nickel/cobalt efflux system permease component RcnA
MYLIAFLLAQTAPAEQMTLTPAGAAIMTVSIGLVLVMTIFCYYRVLREPTPSDHHHAPLEIEEVDHDR